jgi:hypothetical protein
MEVGNRKLRNDLNELFPHPNFLNRPPNFLEGKWEWELLEMEMRLGNFSTWKWEVGKFPEQALRLPNFSERKWELGIGKFLKRDFGNGKLGNFLTRPDYFLTSRTGSPSSQLPNFRNKPLDYPTSRFLQQAAQLLHESKIGNARYLEHALSKQAYKTRYLTVQATSAQMHVYRTRP